MIDAIVNRNKKIVISAILLSFLSIYIISGVLFGTYRTDELFFLASSYGWSTGSLWLNVSPVPISVVIKKYFDLTGGYASGAWFLRVIGAFFLLACFYVLYKTFKSLYGSISNSWLLSWVLALLCIILLSSYRSFEIRPEIISNIALLAAIFLMLRFFIVDKHDFFSKSLIWVSGLLLIISASFSMRHSLPSFAFFIFLLFFQLKNFSRPFFGLIVLSYLALFLYLNFYFYNILDFLSHAFSVQMSRPPREWYEKLVFGGVGPYFKHLYTVFVFVVVVSCLVFVKIKNKNHYFLCVASLASIASYYAFYFSLDVRPFEYVFSIELILIIGLVSTLLIAYGDFFKGKIVYKSFFYTVTIFCIVISLKSAILDLFLRRNPNEVLRGVYATSSNATLSADTDEELIKKMAYSTAVFDQMRARTEYCRRYPNGVTIVHRFMFHPVCLRDGGSLELAGWREKLDLDAMDWRKYQLFSVRNDDALRLNSLPGFDAYADGLDVVYFRSSD